MKNKFWEDRHGNQSSTRILIIFVVLNAILLGWYNLISSGDVASTIALITSVTGVASGWKLLQNKDERTN